jgi:ABC-2 type transport system ATP-binding protein
MNLIGDSRIVFLDEPTTGLDPRSRQMMWALIRDLAHRGMTIFLTTQYLEEADQLANRIGILNKGKLDRYPLDRGDCIVPRFLADRLYVGVVSL